MALNTHYLILKVLGAYLYIQYNDIGINNKVIIITPKVKYVGAASILKHAKHNKYINVFALLKQVLVQFL